MGFPRIAGSLFNTQQSYIRQVAGALGRAFGQPQAPARSTGPVTPGAQTPFVPQGPPTPSQQRPGGPWLGRQSEGVDLRQSTDHQMPTTGSIAGMMMPGFGGAAIQGAMAGATANWGKFPTLNDTFSQGMGTPMTGLNTSGLRNPVIQHPARSDSYRRPYGETEDAEGIDNYYRNQGGLEWHQGGYAPILIDGKYHDSSATRRRQTLAEVDAYHERNNPSPRIDTSGPQNPETSPLQIPQGFSFQKVPQRTASLQNPVSQPQARQAPQRSEPGSPGGYWLNGGWHQYEYPDGLPHEINGSVLGSSRR